MENQVYFNTIELNEPVYGELRQQFLIENALQNSNFFPRPLRIVDLDKAVQDYFARYELIDNGDKIKMYTQSLQRFAEVMNNFEGQNKNEDITIPFMSFMRVSPNVERGENLGGKTSTIPSRPTFPLYKLSVMRNGNQEYHYIEIPQPVYVDITYKLALVAENLWTTNQFNEKLLYDFQSFQQYLEVNGHYMPLHFDSIEDDSQTDLESRRFYKAIAQFTLKGYILFEEDYKVLRSVNNMDLDMTSSFKDLRKCEENIVLNGECDIDLEYTFYRKSIQYKETKIPFNIQLSYHNQGNDNNFTIYVDGVQQTYPLTIYKNQILKIQNNVESNKPVFIRLSGSRL